MVMKYVMLFIGNSCLSCRETLLCHWLWEFVLSYLEEHAKKASILFELDKELFNKITSKWARMKLHANQTDCWDTDCWVQHYAQEDLSWSFAPIHSDLNILHSELSWVLDQAPSASPRLSQGVWNSRILILSSSYVHFDILQMDFIWDIAKCINFNWDWRENWPRNKNCHNLTACGSKTVLLFLCYCYSVEVNNEWYWLFSMLAQWQETFCVLVEPQNHHDSYYLNFK